MRIYEMDDVRALPGDIVREQDFIMRLRHLQRQGTDCSVINLVFGAVPTLHADIEQREALVRQLAPVVAQLNGQFHLMSQGDAFIVTPDNGASRSSIMAAIASAFTSHGVSNQASYPELQHVYHLPQDYAAARERTNHYIEAARAAAQIGAANPEPDVALQGEQVRGPLTPWALDQIIKLFASIDVRRYVRHQTIYRQTDQGWQAASAEYYVSVEELRRERFPRLDIRTPERLFMELCSELDHRLLHQFADQPASLASGPLHLNISVESVLGTGFAKFTHALPPEQRRQMVFELNRGDLLLNFGTTQAAISQLKREGYQIALDALHPAMLPYLNCAVFEADFYKIRMGKDMLPQMNSSAVMQAFMLLPRDKIIFYRCDDQAALEIGKKLGVRLFQGWHVDDVAGQN